MFASLTNSMDNTDRVKELSLINIDDRRDPEEKARDGKSGDHTYIIKHHQSRKNKINKGKVVEVGKLAESKHKDLRKLADQGYTHYAIFRLKDRSTTTIVQDTDKNLFKSYSFSTSDVKISNPVTVTAFKE